MQRHTLIRYDLRGCGLSDRERVDFSFERLVDDFEAVVEAAGHKRFAFIGMAVGTAIGMTYAVRHPERITHLILYGPYTRNRLAGGPTTEQVEEAQVRLKVMDLGWSNDNPAYGQFLTSLHIPDATAEQARAHNDLLRVTTSSANAVGLMRMMLGIDVHEVVPRVRCPTLVLQPRGDSIISFDEGRAVAALIPGARFVPLDTRNFVLLEQEPEWQRFVAELDDFLPGRQAALSDPKTSPLYDLTTREHQVLELVAQGLDNDTIGLRLGISAKTVRNQVSIIFSKLGVNTRAQAIVRAREVGFGRKAPR